MSRLICAGGRPLPCARGDGIRCVGATGAVEGRRLRVVAVARRGRMRVGGRRIQAPTDGLGWDTCWTALCRVVVLLGKRQSWVVFWEDGPYGCRCLAVLIWIRGEGQFGDGVARHGAILSYQRLRF